MSSQWINLGTRPVKKLRPAEFPDISQLTREPTKAKRSPDTVDVLLVNPPAPDGGIWIRSQHRVGRRSRENMIWPQMELATMAATLHGDYTVEVVNLGPSAATNVLITDTLPSTGAFVSASDGGTESGGVVTWPTIASMAARDTVTYTVTYQAPSSGTLTNIGAVTGSVLDPTSANNRSSVETFVGPLADLEVTKTGPATGTEMETITYTVEVVNLGPDAAANVLITDTLPGTSPLSTE